jgi:hypothetical protein
MVRTAYTALLQFLSLIGPIVAVGGMVSADRAPGLSRFLFAKPIGVSRYYLQMWLLRGLGLLLITAILSAVVHTVAPVPWWGAVQGIAVTWTLIGGVGFLASVLAPRDSMYVIGLYAVTTLLDQLRTLPDLGWLERPLAVLPPMHKLGALRTALLGDSGWVWADALHVLGWGLGCVALATVLVRRLPLVR